MPRYVDALKSDHRVIPIDARGHGASDKAGRLQATEGEPITTVRRWPQ